MHPGSKSDLEMGYDIKHRLSHRSHSCNFSWSFACHISWILTVLNKGKTLEYDRMKEKVVYLDGNKKLPLPFFFFFFF
jgi:hypothetical protein